ncbi:MAG: hypothetical protein A2075_09575 [Geobacteraceae bacterium GWC2_58_44]|nr:MAG: hypothetical protein A2075_09575 [Geobacteraceae bacterium GWC2_58_44]
MNGQHITMLSLHRNDPSLLQNNNKSRIEFRALQPASRRYFRARYHADGHRQPSGVFQFAGVDPQL